MEERQTGGRPDTASLVLIANLAATAVMVGVIWYVQLVHYPLMAGWPHEDFGLWEARHRERTGLVVIPPMLVEGITAAALLGGRLRQVPLWMPWAAAVLLGLVWVSTFALQVPCHDLLSMGWDDDVHRRLVSTNWIRTIGWTLRLGLVTWMAGLLFDDRPG